MFENEKKALKDFKIIKKIGEGSFSEVYKVKRISDNEIYALKIGLYFSVNSILVKLEGLNEKEKENSLNEVRILASLNNPQFIIGYKDAFIDETSKSLIIVMEYANGGDLQRIIKNYKSNSKSVPEKIIWKFLVEVCRGLNQLHSMNILHRDLKSANIYIVKDDKTKNFTFKIADLNVAKISKDGLGSTQTGTPYFASPEVWREEPYDIKNDIWSVGCILYELSNQSPPFLGKDVNSLFKNIQKGSYKKIPESYSEDLSIIISKCLKMSPQERPTCQEILKNEAVIRNAKKYINQTKDDSNEINEILDTIRYEKGSIMNDKFPKPRYNNNNSLNILIQDNSLSKPQEKSKITKYQKANSNEKQSIYKDRISIDKDRISIDKDKLSIDKDLVSIDKDKFFIDKDKFSGDKDKCSLDKSKFSIDKEKISLDKEKLPLIKNKINDKRIMHRNVKSANIINYTKINNEKIFIKKKIINDEIKKRNVHSADMKLKIFDNRVKLENRSVEKIHFNSNLDNRKKVMQNITILNNIDSNKSNSNIFEKKKSNQLIVNAKIKNTTFIKQKKENENVTVNPPKRIRRNLFNVFNIRAPNEEKSKNSFINNENKKNITKNIIQEKKKNIHYYPPYPQSQIYSNYHKNIINKPKFFLQMPNSPQVAVKIKTEISQNESTKNKKPISKSNKNNKSEIRIKTENSCEIEKSILNEKYKSYQKKNCLRRNLSSVDYKRDSKKMIFLPEIRNNTKNRPNSSNNISKIKSPQNVLSNIPLYQKLITEIKGMKK